MSKQLMLMLDNISQHTSQLPALITPHEIEGNCKEEREPEFADYIDHFVYCFCSWYASIFHYNWM